MSHASDTYIALAVNFALMSLFAIGGANAAVPEMHRLAVDVMQWMTDRQFTDIFAIAQLTPGPNVIIVSLIGYHVAGLPGALVTTVAMCGPSCLFAAFVGRAWDRFKDATWRNVIQAGLVPLSIGLLAASAFIVARAADQTWMAFAITAATAGLSYWTRWNPLWLFAAAALLGVAGLV
jgi:chromate transporter